MNCLKFSHLLAAYASTISYQLFLVGLCLSVVIPHTAFAQQREVVESPFTPNSIDRADIVELKADIPSPKPEGDSIQIRVSAHLGSETEEFEWVQKKIEEAEKKGVQIEALVLDSSASKTQAEAAIDTLEKLNINGNLIQVESTEYHTAREEEARTAQKTRVKLAMISIAVAGTTVFLATVTHTTLPILTVLPIALIGGIMAGTIQYHQSSYLSFILPKFADRFSLFSNSPKAKSVFNFTESFLKQLSISVATFFVIKALTELPDVFSDPWILLSKLGAASVTSLFGTSAKFFFRQTIAEQRKQALDRAKAAGKSTHPIETMSRRATFFLNTTLNLIMAIHLLEPGNDSELSQEPKQNYESELNRESEVSSKPEQSTRPTAISYSLYGLTAGGAVVYALQPYKDFFGRAIQRLRGGSAGRCVKLLSH